MKGVSSMGLPLFIFVVAYCCVEDKCLFVVKILRETVEDSREVD